LYKTLSKAMYEYASRNLRGDGGRSAAIGALKGVLEYITKLDEDRWPELRPPPLTVKVPLQALLFALEDLDNGAVPPIVRPANQEGRPRNTFNRRLIIEEAAETMRTLTQIGYKRKEAAEIVAELLRDCGFSRSGEGK